MVEKRRIFWDLEEDYFHWLLFFCNLDEEKNYYYGFRVLLNIPFRLKKPRDINRSIDGSKWKKKYPIPHRFLEEKEEIQEFFDKEVSVLEVLLGLALRVDQEITGEMSEEDHPEAFFMEMMRNLKLSELSEREIRTKMTRWMNGTYKKNGEGTPFPVKNKVVDQREREIWDQMQAYIRENYYVGKYSH